MEKSFVNRIVRASAGKTLVGEMEQCTFVKNTLKLTTPRDAEKEKLETENAARYNNTFEKYTPSGEKAEKKAYTAAKDVYDINDAGSFATINVAGGKGKGRRYAGDLGEATIDLGKGKELNDGVETH